MSIYLGNTKLTSSTAPDNMVTTDTNQTITGIKTFGEVWVGDEHSNSKYFDTDIQRESGGNTYNYAFPEKSGTIALTNDIVTGDWSDVTATEFTASIGLGNCKLYANGKMRLFVFSGLPTVASGSLTIGTFTQTPIAQFNAVVYNHNDNTKISLGQTAANRVLVMYNSPNNGSMYGELFFIVA